MRRRILVLVLLAAAPAAPGSAAAFRLGIGDQKPDMFSDQRFLDLGIHDARLAVGWDALHSSWQRAQISQWLSAAHAAGVEPLITFQHSRLPGARRTLPSPTRFQIEFARFRRLYPWVRDYATWNEANHCGEPTCHHPTLVARYYNALRRTCPTCRILAAELLDEPNMVSWVRSFEARASSPPRYWGLHNYLDANRFRTTATRALLGATQGQVWFTETGGIVARRTRTHIRFPQSAAHAAQATAWVFDKLARLSPRITRVYLYHWDADSARDTWDSALIGPHGQPRPAFAVVRRQAQAQAAANEARR